MLYNKLMSERKEIDTHQKAQGRISTVKKDSLQTNKSGCFTKTRVIIFLIFSFVAGALGGFIYWNLSDLPAIKALEEYSPAESSLVYSSDGKLLAELYLERRIFIPYYKVPDHVKKAFIAIEDARFYSHPGVDVIGIVRALYQDVKTRSIAQGGSTITQQLAKMLFLKPERTIKRKLKEAALSIQIEKRYTKDEILGLYLNQAYFGTTAYGIEAASQAYFAKSVQELNIAEAALLASLPKAPALYSPFKHPQKAKERRSAVLRQMLNHKFISKAQYESAENEPLPQTPQFRKYEAPYFVELLRQELESRYNTGLYTSGYRIYSTLDYSMQKAAEEAVRNGIASIDRRVKKGVQAALIAMDVRTGAIKAMVGGTDFWKNQFNRATQALRQPGSAFKPFVYLAAVENGMTASDQILDGPISFKGARPGQVWTPKNYDGEYNGVVTLETALAKSLNAATVRLADRIGLESVIETARRLGIKSTLQPYMPLALGASDVTLMEMVSAYSTFATGNHAKPFFLQKVYNRDNIPVEDQMPEITELVLQESIDEMKILLKAVVEKGTAQRAKELKRTIYGKTGTTNEYTDAWFIGFDDRLAVGVWIGRDDHTAIGHKETGSRAALPVWIEFMKKAPLQIQPDQNP